MSKSATFEVIVGTYEEYLLGYYFVDKHSEIVQSFAAHDHSSSIRAVTFSGHYLASGGADDRIFVYDLKARKEHCMLTHHESTVSCLKFTDNHSHIITGSTDGVLAIVRVGNWQLEKIWDKAHKGAAILDIAIHSSGKLALTLGSDCSLRTWNLVKGRQAYIINLQSKSKDAKSLEKIVWGPDGVHFVLCGGKYAEVWNIESGGIKEVFEFEEKVCSCIWQSDEKLIVGLEDGSIYIICITDGTKTKHKGHESRVKALSLFKDFIISGSSNGEIIIWNEDMEELAKQSTGCRITCLCVVPPIKVKKENENTNEKSRSSEESKVTTQKVKKVVMEIEGSDDEGIVSRKNKQSSKRKTKDNVSEIATPNKKKKSDKIRTEVSQESQNVKKNKKLNLSVNGKAKKKKLKKFNTTI